MVKATIDQCYSVYHDFSEEYYEKCTVKRYNFRKLSTKDASDDDSFLQEVVPDYLSALQNSAQLKRKLSLTAINIGNSNNFRYRFKYIGTVDNKLKHYNIKDDHYGPVYVYKTINDLCGVRLVAPGVREHLNEIKEILDEYKCQGVIKRYYIRSDGNYHAIHCYFQLDNKCFPWEFQIWDSLDASNNHKEHGRHEKERKAGI